MKAEDAKNLRWLLLVSTIGLAAWAGGWDLFGLLWGGAPDLASFFVIALPGLTLPTAVLAIWKSRIAVVLFFVQFLFAYGYQVRVFKATMSQLSTNATGFVSHLMLALLLLCLAVLDTVTRTSRHTSSAPPGAA